MSLYVVKCTVALDGIGTLLISGAPPATVYCEESKFDLKLI